MSTGTLTPERFELRRDHLTSDQAQAIADPDRNPDWGDHWTAAELERAPALYVKRAKPDGMGYGFTGPLEHAQARRELEAWRRADWHALLVPDVPIVRAYVRRWERVPFTDAERIAV